MKESNFISAVVYLHNNEGYAAEFLKKIQAVLEENFKKYEIICVDDCCEDKTIEEVKQYAQQNSKHSISIIHMSYYQGVEKGMNAGIDLAIGDFVLEFDNPYMSYDAEIIMELYRKSTNEGCDVVNAIADTGSKVTSGLFYKLFNKFSDSEYDIKTEAFRITSRRMINRVKAANSTVPYRKVLYAKSGLKVADYRYKPVGESRYKETAETLKLKKELAVDSFVLFTDAAYKFTLFITVLMLILTILAGIYTVTIFVTQKPQAGWTTTMLFLAVSFFALFAVLTIMLKYMSIIMNLIFRKTKYVFEGIEKL